MMTVPHRISNTKKTYPASKAAREDLLHYLYMTGNMDAYVILVSDEYRDYDWTSLIEQSSIWWHAQGQKVSL